ncbi:restriction endonuclease [Streptomyces sp. H27-C3]|uniref:restriction endonuclease n=1 Tax=Streptomyces sp. H27-C3 TaxID=3046305 RepID=UPI0024BAF04D|nr:restriction endonuclease [Streptomyces sp. H27-C3]MDJ0462183.1 restriction endonuclease [Streptomyces sp. H27-C3]
MTIPVRRSRVGDRRPAFSVRQTAVGLGLIAVLICGVGLTAKLAVREGAEHPGAGVIAVAFFAAVASLLLVRRRRRVVRGAAGAVMEVAQDVVDAAAEASASAAAAAEAARAEARVSSEAVRADPLPADLAAPVEDAPTEYAAMDADAFEDAIAELCERDGCGDVYVVGGAGDLGADVIATTPDGRRVVIQCKCYGETNKVGSQDMQRFGGTCYAVHDAHVAAVVTTSAFTDPAIEYADHCGILCFDHEALTAWTDGAGPPPWDESWQNGPRDR